MGRNSESVHALCGQIADQRYHVVCEAEYFDIIASVVKQLEDCPCPKVNVAIGASSHTVTLRKQLLRLLDGKDLQEIESMVTDRWRQEISKLPLSLQNQRPAETPQKFWEEHYFSFLFIRVWSLGF